MENKINLVSVLVKQHNVLRDELHLISNLLENFKEKDSSVEISQLLKQFEKDLISHLELENGVFYVDLIKKMKDRDLDITKTEKFIAEMKDLEKVIREFLDEFISSEIIKDKIEKFREEFQGVSDSLRLRVESEEVGVYSYWQSLKTDIL